MDLVKIIIAIFFPQVAAFMVAGFSMQCFINIILTLLGILPGMVHALWLVIKTSNDRSAVNLTYQPASIHQQRTITIAVGPYDLHI